jgi:predicted enzyme related to lactoylglutathione lyase
MTIGRVDHVWFWVTDMERAVTFYRDALGLEVTMRHEDRWAELDAGSIRIGLHGAIDGRPAEHGGTAVFLVEDLDAATAALRERGVVFDDHLGEVPGYARYASFADPDGNAMQLIEYRRAGVRGAQETTADAGAFAPRGSREA